MSDLIERCADKLHEGCPECGGEGGTSQETGHPGAVEHLPCLSLELLRQTVRDVFREAWVAGWRIVQLAECETEITDEGDLVPCWTVTYEWDPTLGAGR